MSARNGSPVSRVAEAAAAIEAALPPHRGPLALPEHVTNLCLRCKRAEAEVERLRALVAEVTT